SRAVRRDGLVGVMCTPGRLAPAPGVLLLGGSEGGLPERDARELAGRGFTVLALRISDCPDCRRDSSTCRWSISNVAWTCSPSNLARGIASA
ncbi:MAG: hypothetical protein ACR2JQ_03400, partial [Mycobacteriales bacterium]